MGWCSGRRDPAFFALDPAAMVRVTVASMAEDHSTELAALDALLALPVAPYVGLTETEAEDRARGEGRLVRVLSSLDGPRRLDLAPGRVNIELDAAGVVVAADAG